LRAEQISPAASHSQNHTTHRRRLQLHCAFPRAATQQFLGFFGFSFAIFNSIESTSGSFSIHPHAATIPNSRISHAQESVRPWHWNRLRQQKAPAVTRISNSSEILCPQASTRVNAFCKSNATSNFVPAAAQSACRGLYFGCSPINCKESASHA